MKLFKQNYTKKRKYVSWRFVIIALLIILQLVFTFGLIMLLGNKYAFVQIMFFILGIILLIFIINKPQPASHKLPWLFIFLLMPVAGLFIYLAFGKTILPKKQLKRFNKDGIDCSKYLVQNKSASERLSQANLDGWAMTQYVSNTTLLPFYNNSSCHYLPSGESFFERLKQRLNEAEKYVFLEYFILSEGKMLDEIIEILINKVNSGVKVFILYDDIGSMKYLPMHFDAKLRSLGINCYKFNRFLPIISAIHNNRDHRKIAVIDGKYAFTGGINIGDEYINVENRFGHWKDCAIEIEGEAINNFVVMFVQLYNLFAPQALEVNNYFYKGQPVLSSGYVQPFGDGPKPLYSSRIGQQLFLNIIHNAKKYLYITTPYLIVDYSIIEALDMCAKRGVDVRILTPHVPDKKAVFALTRSNYMPLIQAGVKIFEYEPGFIHSKTIVCDDNVAFVGTINFDYRSFVHHFECGALLIENSAIFDVKQDFLQTVTKNGIMQTKQTAKLTLMQKLQKNFLGLFAPLL
ncbi:MAG: cardiolipin synthase [Clostridia bacterium]|nr:cardiolipin synthase [Clostridia bacterium]